MSEKLIYSKLFSEEKVELSSEKVELARKAPSVLKDFENLDSKFKKAEDTIDKAFMSYKKSWEVFQTTIKDLAQERKVLENDIAEITQAAMDLGVDWEDVKGLKDAQAMSRKLDGLVSSLPKLYQEPK